MLFIRVTKDEKSQLSIPRSKFMLFEGDIISFFAKSHRSRDVKTTAVHG